MSDNHKNLQIVETGYSMTIWNEGQGPFPGSSTANLTIDWEKRNCEIGVFQKTDKVDAELKRKVRLTLESIYTLRFIYE